MTATTPPDDVEAIDWRMTRAQKIGGVVGVALGLAGLAQDLSPPVAIAFPVAYGAACAAIPRLRGIVRHRRTGWFAAHQVGMAVIAAGWASEGEWVSAAFNGSWFVSAGVWWLRERTPEG